MEPRDTAADAPVRPVSFEHVIASIAGRFLQADGDGMDLEIERSFAAAGECLEVDRCFTFLPDAPAGGHRVWHVWTADSVTPDPGVVGQVMQQAFPWVGEMMQRHADILVNRLGDLPPAAWRELDYCRDRGIQSFLMCPMVAGDVVVGNIGVDSLRRERHWSDDDVGRVRLLGTVVANAVLRQQKEAEITRLKERLEAENAYLREAQELRHSHGEIVGDSDAVRIMLGQVEQVAPTDANVLILGETGTGKELLARAVHRLSSRTDHPLITVNCAALSPTLIEAELFGREKGAYTGALSRQAGRFEAADGSTLFLDEIGELPPAIQAKLLRVLQFGEFERLGSPRTHHVDVRVVAATNRDLEKAVQDGSFREDLYYRLNVFPITVPPLRERRDDIPQLVWAVVRELEKSMGRRISEVPKSDMQSLARYDWPGNVRELRNVIERAMILSSRARLRLRAPTSGAEPVVETWTTLDEMQRAYILKVLERTGWRVRGRGGSAALLGLKPSTLESRMKKLGIQRP